MKKLFILAVVPLLFWSHASLASPLVAQWADGDRFYCEYGDGQVTSISGNQNCPLSN